LEKEGKKSTFGKGGSGSEEERHQTLFLGGGGRCFSKGVAVGLFVGSRCDSKEERARSKRSFTKSYSNY
jgi:hypothetical protein